MLSRMMDMERRSVRNMLSRMMDKVIQGMTVSIHILQMKILHNAMLQMIMVHVHLHRLGQMEVADGLLVCMVVLETKSKMDSD